MAKEPEKKYVYKSGARERNGVTAHIIGTELERIRLKYGGRLETPDIVKESRPKKAVFNGQFTWDVEKAAYQFNLYEARQLTKCIQVEYAQSEKPPAPAFVNVSVGEKQYYQSSAEVVRNVSERESALRQAYRKMQEAIRSYQEIKDLIVHSDDPQATETDMSKLATIIEFLGAARAVADRLQ